MATTKNIQSVERAFAILESFQQSSDGEHSVKEISEILGLNKSTTFGLINTLTNLGYLQQNENNQKYALGLKLLSFSNTIKVQNGIIRIVHPYLEQISRKYGETAHCAVERNYSVVYVDKVESSGSISINTHIGTQNYLHCTGMGKCILAYMPPEYQEHIYASPLPTKTYNTITNSEQLREEIRKIRADGYAIDNEEAEIGLTCVAVPVFSAPGKIACSISISGMTPRVQIALKSGLLQDLKSAASAISSSMSGPYVRRPPAAVPAQHTT